MPTGIVKWFNSAKGYGFICPNESNQEVFAHFSAILMDGYKCLKAGQVVTFEVKEGPKGLHALNICLHAATAQLSNSKTEVTEEMNA